MYWDSRVKINLNIFFQFLSMEMKREDQMRPYDPKKSVWVPTESHDFKEGLLESDDGTKAVVMLGHEVSSNQTLKCYCMCPSSPILNHFLRLLLLIVRYFYFFGQFDFIQSCSFLESCKIFRQKDFESLKFKQL